MESNEAKVLAILEALRIFTLFHSKLVVESDSQNVASSSILPPWSKIKVLSSSLCVEFRHVGRSANYFAKALAKQGMVRSHPFLAYPS